MKKVELCMLYMPKRSNKGSISLPNEIFEELDTPSKFIAIRKDGSEFIKLLPVENMDMQAFSLHAEVTYRALSLFIKTITKISKEDDDLKFVPELAAPCPGKGNAPCIFDGIVLVVDEEKMERLIEDLSEVKKDGDQIAHSISFKRIT